MCDWDCVCPRPLGGPLKRGPAPQGGRAVPILCPSSCPSAVSAGLASRGRKWSLTPWNRTALLKGPLGHLTPPYLPTAGPVVSTHLCLRASPATYQLSSPVESHTLTPRSASGMWGLPIWAQESPILCFLHAWPCGGHLPQFPHPGMWSVSISPCGERRQGSVWTLQSHPPARGHASPTDVPIFLQEVPGPRAGPGVRASDAARLELGQVSACGLGEADVAFAPADYRAS